MNAAPTTSRVTARAFARQKLAQPIVYLDTETTGIGREDEIIEIAVVDAEGKLLVNSLVKPSKPIPPDSTAIHGITNEMVQKAPAWPILWPTVRAYLVGKTVAAYNSDFDLRLMQQSHARYRLPWRENLNMLDIMKVYADYRGVWDPNRRSMRYFKLEEAGRHFQIDIGNDHRAAADTLLARAVLLAIAADES